MLKQDASSKGARRKYFLWVMAEVEPSVRLQVINDLISKYPKIKKIIGVDNGNKVLGERQQRPLKSPARFPLAVYPDITRPPTIKLYKKDRGISHLHPSDLPGPGLYNPEGIKVSRDFTFGHSERHLTNPSRSGGRYSVKTDRGVLSPGPIYSRYTTIQ